MRALLSKQDEPSLYQSIGNYFSHVLRSNLPTPEKRPKVHFALSLKTRTSANEAHVSSSFTASFHPFWLKFGKNVARYCGKKNCVGDLLFLASFESNDYVSKGSVSFIRT